MSPSLRILALALSAGLAALVPAPSANAAEVGYGNGTVFYDAGPRESNSLTVTQLSSGVGHLILHLTDRAGLSAPFLSNVCRQTGPSSVTCTSILPGPFQPGSPILDLDAELGDGNDSFRMSGDLPTAVDGGKGSDQYSSGVVFGSGLHTTQVEFSGGSGSDHAAYFAANAGVSVSKDGQPNDGRTGIDRDNIRSDVERLSGSQFNDRLIGTPTALIGGPTAPSKSQILDGNAGDDVLTGNGRDTIYEADPGRDGADRISAGRRADPGRDVVSYAARDRGVNVTIGHGGADDGEAGEGDEITGSVEVVAGGDGDDLLQALPGSVAPVELLAKRGSDTLIGADGADLLVATSGGIFGRGSDRHVAGGGADVVLAANGAPDRIDCGTDVDGLMRDRREAQLDGCEGTLVGRLRLVPRVLHATAGDVARLRLSWRHPRGWKRLRRIELRLYDGLHEAGALAILPRSRRISDDGSLALVRRATDLTHRGDRVTARLALRFGAGLSRGRLRAAVEAVDTDGGRQVVYRAGSVRVTG